MVCAKHSGGKVEVPKGDSSKPKGASKGLFKLFKTSNIHQPKEPQDLPTQEHTNEVLATIDMEPNHGSPGSTDTSTGPDEAIKAEARQTKKNKWPCIWTDQKPQDLPTQEQIDKAFNALMIGLEEDPSDYIDTSTGPDEAIKADVHRTKDNKLACIWTDQNNKGSALGQTKGADPKSLFKSPKSKGNPRIRLCSKEFNPNATGTPFKQFVHEWKAQHQASLDRSRQKTTGTSRKYNPEDEAQHPLEKEAQRRASLGGSRQKTTGTSRKYNPEDEAQHPLEKEAQRRASLGGSGKKTTRTSRKFVPAKKPWYQLG
ncbi:hypothetical protein BASA83_012978 [Batrachochytrium salamandrivorans]|nr:hypothetical protein BASA83_012978 [Batrachochytrium salamandrivorans]